jgi:hypothetical protein
LSRIAKGSGPCIPFKKDNEKATWQAAWWNHEQERWRLAHSG